MKKHIYILIISLITACGQSVVPPPEKMLSEKQMENLMYDLAIIDGVRLTDYSLLDSLKINVNDFVYKKHNTDSLSLIENMVYYASFPNKYDKIIKKVEARLKEERQKLSAPTKKENQQPIDEIIDTTKLTTEPVNN